jgi:hypothetical protein
MTQRIFAVTRGCVIHGGGDEAWHFTPPYEPVACGAPKIVPGWKMAVARGIFFVTVYVSALLPTLLCYDYIDCGWEYDYIDCGWEYDYIDCGREAGLHQSVIFNVNECKLERLQTHMWMYTGLNPARTTHGHFAAIEAWAKWPVCESNSIPLTLWSNTHTTGPQAPTYLKKPAAPPYLCP